MDIFSFSAKLMRMDDSAWARHANQWSVYSRIVGGTAVFFALWSGYWIGWAAVVPVALAVGWIYLNPRLFSPPKSTSNWAARGVLGERVFLNRRAVPIPGEYVTVSYLTTAVAIGFILLCVLGFWRQDFWLAFTGWHAATVVKLWFVDRMALLWDQMQGANETYRAWSRGQWGGEGDKLP